ncbi:MAG: TRAP transporter large permease [Clostridiales bacterium]|nr:TRAP transporter large permease [Clostridiales bacterium]
MAWILFGTFILLLVIGVPIAFSVAAAAGVAMFVGVGPQQGMKLISRMFESANSFSLIAVPFFILAGDLLAKGKLSKVLVEFCESFLGWVRGGLSIVSVLAGMFFAAISGSGAATTAAVGATLVPELKKRGYEVDSAAALVAAAGTIGVVIPPSVPMVLYAVISGQVSVTNLFAHGFVPGIIMGAVLIAIALVQAYRRHYPKGVAFNMKNVMGTFLKAIPALLMPVIILVGIFSGIFTPSEAACVAVVYAILVSKLIYRDLTWKDLFRIIAGSGRTSAVIMIIIACSGPFGWALANWRIPEAISTAVLSVSENKYVIMSLISVIILIAGVFMETSSAIIILTPVFLPLVRMLGVSDLHFGILFVVGIAIGMITPPVAINLFVASGITGLPIEKISRSVVPYLIGLILVFLLIVFVPLLVPGLL